MVVRMATGEVNTAPPTQPCDRRSTKRLGPFRVRFSIVLSSVDPMGGAGTRRRMAVGAPPIGSTDDKTIEKRTREAPKYGPHHSVTRNQTGRSVGRSALHIMHADIVILCPSGTIINRD